MKTKKNLPHPIAYRNIVLILLSGMISSCTYLRETPSYRDVELNAQENSYKTNLPEEKQDQYEMFSQTLGYDLTGSENPDLLYEISDWIGTPYKFGGDTRMGADCSGFTKEIYKNVYGVDLERITVNMAKSSRKINRHQLQEGDLVFFRINKRKISHVGIYISKNRFAHASSSRGVIISELTDPYYIKRFAFGGRIKK